MRADDVEQLRAQIAERLAKGERPSQIAAALGCSRTTVHLVKRSLASGETPQRDRRLDHPGPEPSISADQRSAIQAMLTTSPSISPRAARRQLARGRRSAEIPAESLPSVHSIGRLLRRLRHDHASSRDAPRGSTAAPRRDIVLGAPPDAQAYYDLLTPDERAMLAAATSSTTLRPEIGILRVLIRRVLERAYQDATDDDPQTDPIRHSERISKLVGVLVRAIRTEQQLGDDTESDIDALVADVTAEILETTTATRATGATG